MSRSLWHEAPGHLYRCVVVHSLRQIERRYSAHEEDPGNPDHLRIRYGDSYTSTGGRGTCRHSVETVTPITIDGDLAEWNKSAPIVLDSAEQVIRDLRPGRTR